MKLNLIYNISNIIRWIPRLWNNFDWDYDFHMRIIIHKLEDMEKFFRYDGICVDSDKLADEMKEAIIIGKRILKNDYEGDWVTAERNKQKDIEEFFDILKNKLTGWWD